jgi:hypothetical protein
MLLIHCDVIHPDSGEVLAEKGDAFDIASPRAQLILSVVNAHVKHYFTYQDDNDNTVVAALTLALELLGRHRKGE